MDIALGLFGLLLTLSSFGMILFLIGRVFLNNVKNRPKKKIKKLLFYIPISLIAGTVFLTAIGEDDTSALESDHSSSAENNFEELVGEDSEETEFPVAFAYDEKDAKADANGKYSFPIKVKKDYKAKVDSDEENDASVSREKDDTFLLQGTINKNKKKEKVTVTFTSNNDEQYEVIEVSNEEAVKKAKEDDAKLWDKMARENEVELTYGKLNKSQSKYSGLPYHITKGHVMQAQEDEDGNTTLLVELTVDEFGFWDDIIAVYYEGSTDAVDSDFVEVTGTLGEKWDYTTKIGGSNSVPTMQAETIKVIGHNND